MIGITNNVVKKTGTILGVEYPVGTICTATQGSVTLTAKDTTGYAVFFLPSGGDWIVSNGKTQLTVNVEVGRVATAVLSDTIWIIKDGYFADGVHYTSYGREVTEHVYRDGKPCVRFAELNLEYGALAIHGFKPGESSKTLHVEYVYIPMIYREAMETTLNILGGQKLETKWIPSPNNHVIDTTAEYDVSYLSEETLSLVLMHYGISGDSYGYIGNMWID